MVELSLRRQFGGTLGRLISATAVLLSMILAQGCSKGTETDPSAVVPVQAEHPEVGEISELISADAILSPLAQAAISPKITAPVRTLYVQRGSKVKAGQLLVLLENRDLSAAALDNKAQFTAAQAAYEMQTKAQVPEDYRKAELDVAQAKAQLDLQQQIVEARKKLLAEGAIPGRDYDTAAAALVQTQAAYDVARNHLESMKDVSHAASIQQAEGQLSSAKAKYLAAEAQVSYSEIRSPITGVVTDRPYFPGETVNSGTTLITVMDTSSLLAKVHLSQMVAQRLKVGDTASATIPGVDEPAPAVVTLVSPALDPGSTTLEVWLRIKNSQGKFKAGTPVTISIKGRTAEEALKIPLSAVLTAEDGSKFVMVVGDDGTARKKPVQLGISNGEDVQVTQGLEESATVITTGAYGLDDGTKVKVGTGGSDEKKGADDEKKGEEK